MRRAIWAMAALAASFLSGQARACIIESARTSLIHIALPRLLPAHTIVARVTFESRDEDLLYRDGIRARVKKMVQGDYRGRFLIVRPSSHTSCSVPFALGKSGYIVGVVRGTRDGVPVVDPIEVGIGQMLPNRYRLPPRHAEPAPPPR